jgi:hypothetical protein
MLWTLENTPESKKSWIGWQNRYYSREKRRVNKTRLVSADSWLHDTAITQSHELAWHETSFSLLCSLKTALLQLLHDRSTWLPTPKPRIPQAQAAESGVLSLTFRNLPLNLYLYPDAFTLHPYVILHCLHKRSKQHCLEHRNSFLYSISSLFRYINTIHTFTLCTYIHLLRSIYSSFEIQSYN